MSKITITQTRSQIKCPQRQKATLKALGLGRIGKRIVLEGSPQVLGMVRKVEHLVTVTPAEGP
jgi:large subunit ribosomal protein L30